MTTVLITGIGGQDGTLLAKRLLREGATVWGMVNARGGRVTEHGLNLPGLPLEVNLAPGDLRDHERVFEVVDQVAPDQIFNLAGISSVGFSWDHPLQTGASTGLGAVGVFEAAWRKQQETGQRVRVVQASSSEIFGAPAGSPQDEETPLDPISPYGAAKAYAHRMGQIYRQRGLEVSNLILFGHESTLRPQQFVTRKISSGAARIAHALARGMTPQPLMLGNLDARRDWGWAEDYVRAMTLAAQAPEADDFIIGTGHAHSVRDFARTALTHAGVEDWEAYVTVDPALLRPTDPALLVADPTKAREVLGWQPTITFEQLVALMVDHDLALLNQPSA